MRQHVVASQLHNGYQRWNGRFLALFLDSWWNFCPAATVLHMRLSSWLEWFWVEFNNCDSTAMKLKWARINRARMECLFKTYRESLCWRNWSLNEMLFASNQPRSFHRHRSFLWMLDSFLLLRQSSSFICLSLDTSRLEAAAAQTQSFDECNPTTEGNRWIRINHVELRWVGGINMRTQISGITFESLLIR